jgi:hypothetical protein
VQVGDVATLLYGVAALIGAAGSAAAVVINALRSSRRERPVAARQALGRLAKAAADGHISDSELASVLDKLRTEIEPDDEADDEDDERTNDDTDEGGGQDRKQPTRIGGPHSGARRSAPHRRRRRSG